MDAKQNNFDDEDVTAGPRRAGRPALLLAFMALLGLSLCLTAALFLLRGEGRPLRPFRSEATAVALIIDGQPQLVTFPELSENAAAFLNQRIRVTGFYLPVTPPECAFFSGPIFHWSLVSEGLQLNAQGFERALALAGSGTTLTVEGIWRQYSGPYGCGKGPEVQDVWYLQVERIVQPNPLVETTADPAAFMLSGISTPLFPTVGPTGTPRPTTQVTVISVGSPTATLSGVTATAVNGTLIPTQTATVGGAPTATINPSFTQTPTGTRPSGTVTATPTGTLTAPGGTNTPPPGSPTQPPNPYPGNPPTPIATPLPTPGY